MVFEYEIFECEGNIYYKYFKSLFTIAGFLKSFTMRIYLPVFVRFIT